MASVNHLLDAAKYTPDIPVACIIIASLRRQRILVVVGRTTLPVYVDLVMVIFKPRSDRRINSRRSCVFSGSRVYLESIAAAFEALLKDGLKDRIIVFVEKRYG